MITKAVITYDDGSEAVFNHKPAVGAVPVDLTAIPLKSPKEIVIETTASETPPTA